MVKCILKGLQEIDAYSGEMVPFETEYNGIPEAMSMYASGYKHGFLDDLTLLYADNRLEVPDRITDYLYNRYYYGRYIFDENGEECGKKSWKFLHVQLYFGGYENPEVCPKKTGVLVKK